MAGCCRRAAGNARRDEVVKEEHLHGHAGRQLRVENGMGGEQDAALAVGQDGAVALQGILRIERDVPLGSTPAA